MQYNKAYILLSSYKPVNRICNDIMMTPLQEGLIARSLAIHVYVCSFVYIVVLVLLVYFFMYREHNFKLTDCWKRQILMKAYQTVLPIVKMRMDRLRVVCVVV